MQGYILSIVGHGQSPGPPPPNSSLLRGRKFCGEIYSIYPCWNGLASINGAHIMAIIRFDIIRYFAFSLEIFQFDKKIKKQLFTLT